MFSTSYFTCVTCKPGTPEIYRNTTYTTTIAEIYIYIIVSKNYTLNGTIEKHWIREGCKNDKVLNIFRNIII